jgi:periplasmic divalent cation tolerance protein
VKLRALYTTVASADDARRLARVAVERGLAACVQINAIESLYRWQGEVQHAPEWRLLFKTTEAAAPALQAVVLELHPYELPAVYALDVAEASEPYRAWVEQSCRAGAPA